LISKIPPLPPARAFCLFVLAVLVCNVAVPCWFAYQRAATVRVTVLTPARASASRTPPFGRRGILCRAGDLRVLRPTRPRFRFGLTRAPHESPTSGGYRRIHIRRRGRVLRNSPPPASVRSANRPEPWPRLALSGVRRGARGLGLPPAPCAAAPVVFAAIRAAMLRR